MVRKNKLIVPNLVWILRENISYQKDCSFNCVI